MAEERGEMKTTAINIPVCTVVIAVAAIVVLFAYSKASTAPLGGYKVKAKFDGIDGISVGADVRLDGIKVGTVVKEVLDPNTNLAVVTLSIDNDVKLPIDTSASCVSWGLHGDKFVNLSPGADEWMITRHARMITEGGEIESTPGCIDLFARLGELYSSQPGKSGGDKKGDGYEVTAEFGRIDGIKVGADVRLGGIKVGTVVKEVLEFNTYFAVVTLSIDNDVKLPIDTSASCVSWGLLGDKYLNLSPGVCEQLIADGGEIESTRGCIDLSYLLYECHLGLCILTDGGGDKNCGDRKGDGLK